MAKEKRYRVLYAFPAVDKEGKEVHITRENEHRIHEILKPSTIKAQVEGGALAEDEVDASEAGTTDSKRTSR